MLFDLYFEFCRISVHMTQMISKHDQLFSQETEQVASNIRTIKHLISMKFEAQKTNLPPNSKSQWHPDVLF